MELRLLRDEEKEQLKDFLYEALFVTAGSEPFPRAIVYKPELSIYYENFGDKADDNCIVAEVDGKVVGAVWTRIMDDYGHIDDETPSLAISLYCEYRGKGYGTAMMKRMLEVLKEKGYRKVSLSVQKANRAVRLYESLGFKVLIDKDDEYIMVREL